MKLRILLFASLISNVLFAQNFHDTQGKLEISNSGQTIYTLPIAMPPSIKDVGPIINLIYVSGQNGGIAGQGWNINSISNLTRISTRQDIEGYRDGVDFDSDDKLALDGQRLLLKTGNYWAAGSTYETEVQSNTKIELKGSGTTMFFIVTSPDGSRSWYGNYSGMDGTDLTAYYITRFEDANGNFMTYHYSKPYNKSLCINEIRFSANVATNPTTLNKIVFTYKLANRKESGYIKGVKIEKVELLDKIEVFTNNLLFKKYQLTHVADALGYQRVSQLQEFNGALEAANPILFEYKTTADVVTENVTGYTDALDISTSPDLAGDFDGDGRLDFISGTKLYTKLFQGAGFTYQFPYSWYNETKRLLFVATTLTSNKINQKQSIVKADEAIDNINFKIYNLEFNGIQNSYSKTIVMDNSGNCSDECGPELYDIDGNLIPNTNSHCTSPTYSKKSNKYIEGDFNGDTISDVLILSYDETKVYRSDPADPLNSDPFILKSNEPYIKDPSQGKCNWHLTTSTNIKEARLIDLNPSSPSSDNTIGNFGLTSGNIQLLQNGERFVMDFNSDGKADILMIETNKEYRILSFKQLQSAPWAELEVLGQGVLDGYSKTKQILFGDFNGDGKPDISLPIADENGCEGCSNWEIYYSNPNPTGGIYFVKESYNIVEYRPSTGGDYDTQWHSSSYYAMDINKDGKSDIVRVWSSLWQYSPFWDPQDIDSSWRVSTFINNIGLNGGFTNNYSSPSTHNSDDNSRPIPLASNYKYRGLDSDLLMIRYHGNNAFAKTVTYIDFKKDFSEDNLLQKVTQSNGSIIDEITYDAMVPNGGNNGLGSLDDFYSSTENLEYPLIEIKQMATNKLVWKLKNTSLGIEKRQDFQYHGLAVNLNGIGVIGFKKTARSSWYSNNSDKKTWSVTEYDATKRGSLVKTFSILLNGNEKINFGNNYSNLLSKSENTYNETVNPISKRYSILLNTQTSTDYLTNIVNQKIYNSYSNDFLLPTSVNNNKLLGTVLHGSSLTLTTYDNNSTGIGNNYFIGRPSIVNTTNTVYVNTPTGSPDTKTISENYYYTNANLTKTEKKANGSAETLVENFVYLSNGLLQRKTISATGTTTANAVSSRTTSFTYDSTNRFIKTSTDIEGLVTTNLTFHALYGMVLTQQNPFSQITTSTYDNWGKRTKVTDFLGKSINYTYTRVGDIYITLQVGDDGSSTMVENDALARQIRSGAIDINGNWIYSNTEYDFLGRKLKDSDPYLSSASPTLWTIYEYDDYNRTIKTTSPTGKIVNTTYNGLTIAAADTVMTKTKTMNANGQVIAATDTPGGTITYKFDANNNLIDSDYDGIKITIQYDNWGRKTQLVDSSAGTYTTSYNAFGEINAETTPKGTTTYNLDPFGKVISKAVVGDGTSITSTYTYDSTNKWLTNIAVVNPNDGNSNYAYTYDTATKQLNKSIENLYPVGSTTAFAKFTKQLTFDNFGRVLDETSTATSHGKTSSKTITHNYKNGVEWQLLDGAIVKLQTNTVNQRGQVTSAILGNGIAVSNSYDDFGYNTQNKHLLSTTNVMTLNNVFEPVLANLTSRTNSMFDMKENFIYDSQDRLTTWEGAGQNVIKLPFNSTTEGFTFVATGISGSVVNSAGTLKVTLKSIGASANKVLTVNAATGDKFRVRADITNKTGTTGVIVNAVMLETDPLDVFNFVEIPIGPINNGLFDFTYTTSDFVSNPKLTLKFIIDENSPFPINGGGEIPPSTIFYVDNLTIDNMPVSVQNYDNRGRITENALGQYNYTINGKPYQNSSVITTSQANSYYATKPLQSISYNAFKAPIQIEEQGIDKISFGYNAMLQRSVMYYGSTDNDKLKRPIRKYFSADGSMEIKATFVSGNTITPASVELITYIDGDAYSSSALIKSDGTTQNYFYLHRDYQGSIMAITNAAGAVVEKRLYNPWGEIVKIQDGAGNNLTKLTFFDRGYTGHQHLESVGLIHMNGRLYDPKLHRFLSPDNFVQDPYNTQSFNRYGYCWNNPLKFTDKSGELLDVVLIGAGIALAAYFTANLISGQPITLKGALMAAFIGAVSGAVTFGIGTWTGTINNFVLKATTQALSHGVFQGTLSGIQGGGFWAGAAAGALSSIASSAFAGGQNTKLDSDGVRVNAGGGWGGAGKFAQSTGGMIAFGTVMGGAGAALTGGNFWQGAVTGLVVSGLNHAMHSMQEDPLKKHAGKVKHTLEEWSDRYADKSWGEIATEAGWKDGQPLGPKAEWRYIKAPDGNVMDMRHVSIVGYGYGETAGNVIEHLQNLVPRMRPSAFDPQDYYSNKVGAMFSQLRSMGSWSSNSWSYDFRRFIDTQYSTLFKNYKP